MKCVNYVFPAMVLILSFVFGVFLVLDFCNPAMNLVDTRLSHLLLWAFCTLSVICTVNGVYKEHKQKMMSEREPQEWC